VHLRSAPRALSDGRVVWDGIYIDVTRQKQIEQALRESLERLDLAQEAGHIGVFDWHVQEGRVVWSEEEQRIFGVSPGTFEGTVEGWTKRLVAEDAERMQRDMEGSHGPPRTADDFRVSHRHTVRGQRWIEGAVAFPTRRMAHRSGWSA
jgi:PAS domain-containing protein